MIKRKKQKKISSYIWSLDYKTKLQNKWSKVNKPKAKFNSINSCANPYN